MLKLFGTAATVPMREKYADPEVINVAVRLGDREAFLGVIYAREEQLAENRHKPALPSAQAAEVASFALAAKEALQGEAQPDLAAVQLEIGIALAIDLLADLKGKG